MSPRRTPDVRVVPGVPSADHIAALAHVSALGGGYLVVLGRDVTERNIVKILNHEMLHIVFQNDLGTFSASQALDSYDADGAEYLHVEYDRLGLPQRLKWG